jgi:hypothetical protein
MSNKKKGDYAVGYGKPPRHTQFKKGQSGNPSGKRKGTLNVMSLLEQALLEPVVVNEGGQRSTISKGEALIKLMVNQATGGDARARQTLLGLLRALQPPVDPGASAPGFQLDPEVAQQMLARLERCQDRGEDDDP